MYKGTMYNKVQSHKVQCTKGQCTKSLSTKRAGGRCPSALVIKTEKFQKCLFFAYILAYVKKNPYLCNVKT